MSRYFLSTQEREKLFCTELVKHGVSFPKAFEASKILASGKPEQLLTERETRLTQEVCRRWLRTRKRRASVSSFVQYQPCTEQIIKGKHIYLRRLGPIRVQGNTAERED